MRELTKNWDFHTFHYIIVDYCVDLEALTVKCRLKSRDGHGSWVNGCAVSPLGSIVASASSDYTIKLWNTQSPICVATLKETSGV